jgi:hypothetical protein
MREYLAIAEAHSLEEYPLDVRSVAAHLNVSRTVLYKYGLTREINEAERRRCQNAKLTGKMIERRAYTDRIRDLENELVLERERNKKLVAKIQIMEGNAGRLGIDPEELHKAIPKPIRTVSRAGSSHKRWFGKR